MKKIDEQRYLWLLRIFGIFIALSIILNIVLIFSLNKIAPQTKWEAFFVEAQDKNIETLYIQRASNLNISQNSVGYQIAKSYIIQYIIERESLYTNPVKMRQLWGIDSNLFFMSTENTYKSFYTSSDNNRFNKSWWHSISFKTKFMGSISNPKHNRRIRIKQTNRN